MRVFPKRFDISSAFEFDGMKNETRIQSSGCIHVSEYALNAGTKHPQQERLYLTS